MLRAISGGDLHLKVREDQRLALEVFWSEWRKECDLDGDLVVHFNCEDAFCACVLEGDLVGGFHICGCPHPRERFAVDANETGPANVLASGI
jgi:hypothetical protein